MKTETTITKNDLIKMLPKIKGAMDRAADLTASEVWGNLQEYSPKDHGRLAGSWNLRKLAPRMYSVGTDVEYALVQNYGRSPFTIYPKRAKVLRFEKDGKVIFAKSVNHPGIKGKKYIEKSIRRTEGRTGEFVRRALDERGL